MTAPDVGTRVRRSGGAMRDGQIGWIIEHEGRPAVRLDRGPVRAGQAPPEHTIVPWNPVEWAPAVEPPIAPMQVARICYEADRQLRTTRGEYGVREWNSLREPDRIAWMQGGPPADDVQRRRLYTAIKAAVTDKGG